jgi:4-nitrophenyl phosphatase
VLVELKHLHGLIIDMDGVLYHGNEAIHGAREFLEFLRQKGLPFILVTNNSTLTTAQYVAKLGRMGIQATAAEILTSAEATATHLARTAPPGSRVYLIGGDGIRAALQARGFVLTDQVDVPYVVVGLDRQLTYAKLATAARAIRNGAQFIATNADRTYPSEVGLVPGAGATLAALEAATDTAPLVIGKPQPAIFQLALQRMRAEPAATAVVGDGLYTDVLGGHGVGLMTILLMSGVTSPQQLAKASPAPDRVYEDIAALHRAWRDVAPAQEGASR